MITPSSLLYRPASHSQILKDARFLVPKNKQLTVSRISELREKIHREELDNIIKSDRRLSNQEYTTLRKVGFTDLDSLLTPKKRPKSFKNLPDIKFRTYSEDEFPLTKKGKIFLSEFKVKQSASNLFPLQDHLDIFIPSRKEYSNDPSKWIGTIPGLLYLIQNTPKTKENIPLLKEYKRDLLSLVNSSSSTSSSSSLNYKTHFHLHGNLKNKFISYWF